MRVSSLSDPRLVALISKYFVPSWVSRDRYQLDADKAEAVEVRRLDADRKARKLPGGAVCVFVVAPNGDVMNTLHVGNASKPAQLLAFLQKIVKDKNLKPRNADKAKASAAPPPANPKATNGGRLFEVCARFDDKQPERGTSRDVIELSSSEWTAFVPPTRATVGTTWTVKKAIGDKLLKYAFPPLPHYKPTQVKLVAASLQGKVTATKEDEIAFEITGKVDLVYPFLNKPTDGKVKGTVRGLGRYNPVKKQLTELVIVADRMTYVWTWQGKSYPRNMGLSIALEPWNAVTR